MVSSPKPPDPVKTANAQGAANREAAEASAIIGNVNERNPYGTISYNKIGEELVNGKPVSRYERVTELSPEQQALLNQQNQMQGNLAGLGVSQSERLQGLLGTNLNTEGLTDWQTYQRPQALGDFGDVRQDQGATDRQAIENAMLSRYREQSGKDRSAQDAALAARGLNPGSAQYTDVMDSRNKSDVDAYNQAYLASGAESRAAQDAYNQAQNQRFTQGMGRAQFDISNANDWVNQMNALRNNQLTERQTIRNAPINEIAALMGGSQVSVPQGAGYNAPSVGSVPIGDYIMQNYNARAQNAANKNAGLFGLGSAFLGMF